MPLVTGDITDVGLASIDGVLTRLEFIASQPFIDGNGIRVGSTLAVIDGTEWAVELAPTSGDVHYRIVATWSRAGERHSQEVPARVTVPASGGPIGDLPGVPLAPEFVWVGPEPPADRTRWWLGDSDGLLKRWVV